jgi:hypothetical protein
MRNNWSPPELIFLIKKKHWKKEGEEDEIEDEIEDDDDDDEVETEQESKKWRSRRTDGGRKVVAAKDQAVVDQGQRLGDARAVGVTQLTQVQKPQRALHLRQRGHQEGKQGKKNITTQNKAQNKQTKGGRGGGGVA